MGRILHIFMSQFNRKFCAWSIFLFSVVHTANQCKMFLTDGEFCKQHPDDFTVMIGKVIMVSWLQHTRVDVPPCSRNFDAGSLASRIE